MADLSRYTLPCDLPNFQQSAPRGDGWQIAPNHDPRHDSALTWQNSATGESIVCPAIWYNAPASSYAATLRYNAESSDRSAARMEADSKSWSASDAEHMRRQARRLRAMAMLCDRNPTVPAGAIDMRGLSNPGTPRDVEAATVEAIEAGN